MDVQYFPTTAELAVEEEPHYPIETEKWYFYIILEQGIGTE